MLKFNKTTTLASAMTVICLLITLTFTFYDVNTSEKIRNNYIAQEISNNSEHITIPLLPHQKLIHEDDSKTHWNYYFHYKGKSEMEFDFAPFENWKPTNNFAEK